MSHVSQRSSADDGTGHVSAGDQDTCQVRDGKGTFGTGKSLPVMLYPSQLTTKIRFKS